MTDITIQPEAVEAALPFVAMCQSYCKPTAHDCQCRKNTFFALRAGIAAWPGAFPHTFRGPLEGSGYVLPLPQETRDE